MLNRRAFVQTSALGLFAAKLQGQLQGRLGAAHHDDQTSRGHKIAEIAQSISVARDIPFVKRAQRTLYLDVYHQSNPNHEPVPAIIYFGLSAWKSDTKKFWAYILGLDHLENDPVVYLYPPVTVPRGYVVVSAECRVAREAVFPAQIHDGKCAIKWMRAHAKDFNIDPQRIGVMGGSASGYLAAMLAVTRPEDGLEDKECYLAFSSGVQAAYCQSGMYDFVYYEQQPGDGSLARQGAIRDFLGGSYAKIPKVWRRASPVNYIRPGDPPFLLMHGIQDRRVPYVQMGHFAKLLKKASVPVEAISINHFVHGAIPGVMPQPSDNALDQIIYQFFDQHLKRAS
ncbi:MAG: alpha/beta hydrolase fold domain-containing protein [Terriglobia bacterium]